LPDDTIQIFDEIYESGLTDEMCARRVLERLDFHGAEIDDVAMGYADPASPQSIRTFQDAGIPMHTSEGRKSTKINNVFDGIVQCRVSMTREDRPSLRIDGKRCPNLVKELGGYVFSTTTKTKIEAPQAVDDHSCDAYRYFVVGSNNAHVPFLVSI